MLPLLPQKTSVLNRFFFLSFSLFKYFRLRFSSMLLLPTSHTLLKFKDQVEEMLLLSNATFNATHLYRKIADKYFSFIRSVWSELVVCDCWILVSSPSLYRWLRSHIFHLTKSSVVIGYYHFGIAQFERPSQPELCQLLYFPFTWNNNISVQLAQYKLKVLKFVWSCYSTTATQVL